MTRFALGLCAALGFAAGYLFGTGSAASDIGRCVGRLEAVDEHGHAMEADVYYAKIAVESAHAMAEQVLGFSRVCRAAIEACEPCDTFSAPGPLPNERAIQPGGDSQ